MNDYMRKRAVAYGISSQNKINESLRDVQKHRLLDDCLHTAKMSFVGFSFAFFTGIGFYLANHPECGAEKGSVDQVVVKAHERKYDRILYSLITAEALTLGGIVAYGLTQRKKINEDYKAK